MSEETEEEESETEVSTFDSDDDDASTDVEELSDESSENDDNNDDDDDEDDDAEDNLNEVTNEEANVVSGKKRKRSNKKGLILANEINNHAVYESASLMSYQILMNEDEQKLFFRNWTTEKISDTRDIDFAEWQKEHSTREAYFFRPDNVSLTI